MTLAAIVAIFLSGAIVWQATQAAFTATTGNTGNTVTSGTVQLADNDADSALFTLSNAKPGDTQTSCVNVAYTGTLGAQVRMRASGVGTLAPYLTLTVTRGTFSTVPGSGSCTGFTADATAYTGGTAGVAYTGLLSAFPTTWAAGLVDPSTTTHPTPEVWTTGEAHAYKLQITVNDDNNAQGKTSAPTFTWEARDASDVSAGSYYAQAVLADNPASYWRLNETNGTTAVDTKGPLNGTYIGGPALNGAGPFQDNAGAPAFDVIDDRVDVGDHYDFAGTAAFSVEMWVNTTAIDSGYRRLITKEDFGNGGAGWALQLKNGTNEIEFLRAAGGGSDRVGTSDPALPGGWHHVAATYDATTMRLYMNGVLKGSTASSRSLPNSTWGLTFGSAAARQANFAVYNYALTATQVQAHYNARN